MGTQHVRSAISEFRREFSVDLADTPDLINEAYRLRHQVYCLERGFEEPGEAEIESDEFDRHSRHVVVRRRRGGEVVGTLRLVIASPRLGEASLPMHRICESSQLRGLPTATTAEVSRFAVSKERRDNQSPAAAIVRLGLVQGAVRISRDLRLTHWCAMMERSLLRLLRSTAIDFSPLGPMVEYHGLRQPTYADISLVLRRMRQVRPELWDLVTEFGSLWHGSESYLAAA